MRAFNVRHPGAEVGLRRINSRLHFLARTSWVLLFAFILASAIISSPHLVSNIAQLSPLYRPDPSWTVEQVTASVQAINIPFATFVLIQLLLRIATPAGFFFAGALIFFKKPLDISALAFATILILIGWSSGWINLFEELIPTHKILFRSISLEIFSLIFLLPLIFPDGRFVPRWTLWLAIFNLITAPLNAFEWPLNTTLWPFPYNITLPFLVFTLSIYAGVYRYRHVSNSIQRQQTKWVLFSLAFLVFGYLLPAAIIYTWIPAFRQPGPAGLIFFMANQIGGIFATVLIPVSIVIAIFRYRLWDIDLIIHRGLMVGLLTAINLGLYLIITWLIGQLLYDINNSLPGFLAAGVMLLVYQPVRMRIQQLANRLVYGNREDPYSVITRLGEQLESSLVPKNVIPVIVCTIKDALNLPYVAITVRQREGYQIVLADGEPLDQVHAIPLSYQNEPVGELIFSPMSSTESLKPKDQQLLNDLARHAGLAIYAQRKSLDLQVAHSRLVNAREEERRRLQRDLHDGLGLQLATISMKLDIAQAIGEDQSSENPHLLSEIHEQMKETIAFVRHLVYALRPTILDQLGLSAAISEHARQEIQAKGILLKLDLPKTLPPLPAALEVAVYYIVVEALTNIIRHACAQSCQVHLSLKDGLFLEISDDGIGINPGVHAGIGIQSMEERALNLGGTFKIMGLDPRGTRVMVHIPVFTE